MTNFLGIDPGKQGALALIYNAGMIHPNREGGGTHIRDSIRVGPMPMIVGATKRTISKKTGKRTTKKIETDRYDAIGIVELIESFPAPLHVVVEELHTMPTKMFDKKLKKEIQLGGHKTNFERGYITGGLEFMLATLALKSKGALTYELVKQHTWHAAMFSTKTKDSKQTAIITAKRLFPHVSLRLSARAKKDNANVADALLLAEYGRRKQTR